MYSLRELYRIGFGPSSSHTIGPFNAAVTFRKQFPDAYTFRVSLYGSLAATGKGHFTDGALKKGFEGVPLVIEWYPEVWHEQHPNGLLLEAFDKNGQLMGSELMFSVGGGAIVKEGQNLSEGIHVYPHNSMDNIVAYCKDKSIQLWEYVEEFEGLEIWDFLEEIRITMMQSIENGLNNKDQYMPVAIPLIRRAPTMYAAAMRESNANIKENSILMAYAQAVSEENGSMGLVVTAPTCGACGIVPAVLRYLQEFYLLSDQDIRYALAVAGILGLLAKHNASISGAEAGCQAEVGVACSMAAGAAAFLLGHNIDYIENAAEIAMEHHLGLTCDPVGGYVLIPCIERNANGAVRALQSAYYVRLTGANHLISYDEVLKTMLSTGKDMLEAYRETALGGLAKIYSEKVDIPYQKGVINPKNYC
ncbi:L-serine dehydratase [Brevinema andersonii]|uniref:L-serine ammonia-lyase n=1 Tax=Brevinema andersonii TaxID=34097 RepID=A0A1I1E7A4_BREAD|nr:L-serine ammonia-lyase, iron-sulfur-dependent, subunit alpha [Brevinema andersonii]SFB82957.1 L-serine dehydratase [Brevinema andersonii]